jgi:hypothetical protein
MLPFLATDASASFLFFGLVIYSSATSLWPSCLLFVYFRQIFVAIPWSSLLNLSVYRKRNIPLLHPTFLKIKMRIFGALKPRDINIAEYC